MNSRFHFFRFSPASTQPRSKRTHSLWRIALWGIFCLAAGFVPLYGENESKPAEQASEEKTEQDITFWLLDDNGQWKVPLPNWSEEDVSAFLDRKEEQKKTATYTILSFNASGQVGATARLELEYRVSLNSDPTETVRVPLGLKEGIYRPEPDENGIDQNFKSSGPGTIQLDVDPLSGGYAALITPRSDDSQTEQEKTETGQNIYTISFTLLFPVQQTANTDERLLLLTPPAAVSSQARLVVPLPDVEINASEGVLAAPPISLDGKSSEIKITGFNRSGVTTDIRWRPAEKNEAALPVTYRIEDALVELTPGGDGLEYSVRLPIRIFGGNKEAPTRIFRVELPEGTRPDIQSVHVVSREDADIPNASFRELHADENRPRSELEVSVPGDIESLLLRFTAFAPIGEDMKWECTGFHLDGAQKETGDIVVRLPDDENILPDLVPGTGVRDIENDGENTADDGSRTARFRFYKEPFSLKSDPIPRQTRVIAVPEFQILVGGSDLNLKARINYSVYGAPLRALRTQPGKWIISSFGSSENIDIESIHEDPETGEFVIPLRTPAEGDFSVEWNAVRELNRERDQIEFELPKITADWTASSVVVIVPDDNVELVPLYGRLTALEQKKQINRPLLEIPKRQQPPLIYQVQKRGLDSDTLPLFSARFIEHSGSVSAASETVINVDASDPVSIEQTLTYHIQYVPANSLEFNLPGDLARIPDLEVSLDGKPVQPETVSDSDDTEGKAEIRKKISLPSPGLIGDVRLSFRYKLKDLNILPERSNIIDVFLVRPEGIDLEKNSVKTIAPRNYSVYLPEGADNQAWTASEGISDPNSLMFRFTAQTNTSVISLRAIVKEDTQNGGVNVIERLWAQTWINADSRFERLYARVVGGPSPLEIILPEGTQQEQIEVKLDGIPVSELNFSETDRNLRIPLPETAKTKAVLVDLSYLIVGESGGNPLLTFPDFTQKGTTIRRCYRQIILPEYTHLRRVPKGWMPEDYDLTRSGLFIKRRAAMGTNELANWVGTPDYEVPPKNTNVYLLGSFNPPVSVRLALISRAAIFFLGSGIALLLGILYIYVPRIRNIETFAIPIILSLSAILIRPSVVLLFLQTAAAGVILTLLVFLLRRITGTSAPARVPVPGRVTEPEPPHVPEPASEHRSSAISPKAPQNGESTEAE